MWPYLVCLFTWLAGLVSEGHEKRGREEGGEDPPWRPALILLKTNCGRVNIFELKSSKVEINGRACVGPAAVSAFLGQSRREAEKRNERERRREQLKSRKQGQEGAEERGGINKEKDSERV